mgnify:CR=1 FL=1|jgi:hypothetical protein|tara:strand:+ start:809 stop:946 length:138 start_codon:yes stop_codon:yes gene_type:complete
MTSILQELQKYADAYDRLFAFINDREPFLLSEFIANDELYQEEEE